MCSWPLTESLAVLAIDLMSAQLGGECHLTLTADTHLVEVVQVRHPEFCDDGVLIKVIIVMTTALSGRGLTQRVGVGVGRNGGYVVKEVHADGHGQEGMVPMRQRGWADGDLGSIPSV